MCHLSGTTITTHRDPKTDLWLKWIFTPPMWDDDLYVYTPMNNMDAIVELRTNQCASVYIEQQQHFHICGEKKQPSVRNIFGTHTVLLSLEKSGCCSIAATLLAYSKVDSCKLKARWWIEVLLHVTHAFIKTIRSTNRLPITICIFSFKFRHWWPQNKRRWVRFLYISIDWNWYWKLLDIYLT